MNRFKYLLLSILLIIMAAIALPGRISAQPGIPKPEEHFGFVPGTDYMLFNYEKLIEYLTNLDKASPMLKLVENGQSPMGRKMYIAFISSEANIKNFNRLREINKGTGTERYPTCNFYLRVIFMREGKYDKSIESFKKTLSGFSPVSITELGVAYSKSNTLNETQSMFDTLEARAKTEYVPYSMRGALLSELGRDKEALEYLKKRYIKQI